MPYPRLSDDGQTVEIDLHGASVREAESMLHRLFVIAARRGRGTVRIIHGASTSESDTDRPTIRSHLLEMLERGTLSPEVSDWFAFDTSTTVSLATPDRVDARPISIHDVV
jgi:DNA-nicking Smr family endonuclease